MKAWRTMTRMIILRTFVRIITTQHGYASRADRSIETVSDSPDEELGKANAIS